MTEPEFDLLVAGAGGAGLTAALAASQRGLRVLLVEKDPAFNHGCNTAMSTSMIPAGGSRWQAAAAIDDSPQRFLADVLNKTSGRADPTVSRVLTSIAPELVEWLADHVGLPLELPTDFLYPGHSVPRCHTVPTRSGRELHRHLLEVARSRNEITLAAPMELVAVESRDPQTDIHRALIRTPDGGRDAVTIRALVLATGGYGASRALVGAHIPEMAGALYFGGTGSTGDALRIGSSLGADTGYLGAYQGHGSVAVPENVMLTWIAMTHGGVMVNSAGQRFADESQGYSEFARYVIDQPGATAWAILDRRIDALCEPFADYLDLRESGALQWRPSVEALAGVIGCDPEVLGSTLAAASAAAEGRAEDSFGRAAWEAPLSTPLATVRVTAALFHTQGGLLVDERARVLAGGKPIEWLLAAGGAAAGMSGTNARGYLAGNGLLAALGLGYVAGRSAPPELDSIGGPI